jgi:hypothetical protein
MDICSVKPISQTKTTNHEKNIHYFAVLCRDFKL